MVGVVAVEEEKRQRCRRDPFFLWRLYTFFFHRMALVTSICYEPRTFRYCLETTTAIRSRQWQIDPKLFVMEQQTWTSLGDWIGSLIWSITNREICIDPNPEKWQADPLYLDKLRTSINLPVPPIHLPKRFRNQKDEQHLAPYRSCRIQQRLHP